MKIAVFTPRVSHFEVPLFRLMAVSDQFQTRVFHSDPLDRRFYDSGYQAEIDWGDDLGAGYDHLFAQNGEAMGVAAWAWGPDVVLQYGYSWPGALHLLWQAHTRRIPVVHRGLMSPLADPRLKGFTGLRRMARPWLLRRFDAHHFGGSFSQAVLAAAGIPAARCYFVPFSVDSPWFADRADDPLIQAEAIAIRAKHGWSEADPVVLFIGQHEWVKGLDIAVAAVAKAQAEVSNLKLLVAGSGPMTGELLVVAERALRPGSFAFSGYVPSRLTPAHYLASNLALFPSRYETWARAINEAMLARRPCLASNKVAAVGGLVEEGVTGMVVDDLSPESYAVRIADYFRRSPASRASMGEAARTRALEFSYEHNIESLYRSFEERMR